VAHVHKPNYLETEIGGLWFEASQGKYFLRPPISKLTRAKWTGGVAQVSACFVLQSGSHEFKPQYLKK
jgi:hypothetical protein